MTAFALRKPIALSVTLLIALVAGAGASAATLLLMRLAIDPSPVAATRTLDTTPTPTPTPTSAPDEPPSTGGDLNTLRAELERAEAERSQLADSLLALNRRSEAIEASLVVLRERSEALDARLADAVPQEFDPMLPSGEVGDMLVAGESTGDDPPSDRRLDERESLLAAGLDPQSVDDIRRRRDSFELARLELIDRATREGWRGSDRFEQDIEALEENRPDLRDELGDETYDRYLYEQGGGNRVGVSSVMSGSVAERSGLQSGDVITSYAGQRVFRLRELQSATREGSYGESVQLSVRRDGQVVAIEVPRGPLGITLSPTRRSPE